MKTNRKHKTGTGKCMHSVACLLVAGLLAFCCCDSESIPPELAHLKGTKWKLAGIVDVETGVLEEIIPKKGTVIEQDGTQKLVDGEPMDCEKCYTLTFTADAKAQGWSVSNELYVSFFDPIQISSANIFFSQKPLCGGTEVGESPQPTRYIKALTDLTSYMYYNNELKLFYSNNRNYLLYKLIQQ
ncbi:MAG: hypothetical protein LBB90_03340 [Tannerella sp.]|jgi:hypothetical protein|nr:hypothetical protein [Tannerella sp.]